MIGRAINSGERICVTSCYLTTKIPSALLVAVVWLQHTRYPRFRRGTLDYGVTTSSTKRGRVGYGVSCGCTLVYPCFPNAYAIQRMLKSNILIQITRFEQDRKRNKFGIEESIGSFTGTKFVVYGS
jgi:hypothetical protein